MYVMRLSLTDLITHEDHTQALHQRAILYRHNDLKITFTLIISRSIPHSHNQYLVMTTQ